MTSRAELRKILADLNPDEPIGNLTIYVDAFVEYKEAQRNIAEHGAIVFHPKTGAPIENPYLSVRDKAAARLAKFDLEADPLWND